MTPVATQIWNSPVIRPRTSFGEHSATFADVSVARTRMASSDARKRGRRLR